MIPSNLLVLAPVIYPFEIGLPLTLVIASHAKADDSMFLKSRPHGRFFISLNPVRFNISYFIRGFLDPPPAKNILSESRLLKLMASDTEIEVSWVRVAINEFLVN